MIKKFIIFICLLFCINNLTITSLAENNIYRKVSNENMKIALTFDDGPHPGRTPEILNVLNKFNVKATFFLIGQNIEYYPETFKKIISEGHEIGNHTFSHKPLNKCSDDTLKTEIESFDKVVSEFNCKKTSIIRPPGGLYNDALKKYATENDYSIVLWSIDTMDWSHKSVDDIVDNILLNTNSGDIILMHDFISGQSSTPKALEIVIPILLERGFEFVTVSELIKKSA